MARFCFPDCEIAPLRERGGDGGKIGKVSHSRNSGEPTLGPRRIFILLFGVGRTKFEFILGEFGNFAGRCKIVGIVLLQGKTDLMWFEVWRNLAMRRCFGSVVWPEVVSEVKNDFSSHTKWQKVK